MGYTKVNQDVSIVSISTLNYYLYSPALQVLPYPGARPIRQLASYRSQRGANNTLGASPERVEEQKVHVKAEADTGFQKWGSALLLSNKMRPIRTHRGDVFSLCMKFGGPPKGGC